MAERVVEAATCARAGRWTPAATRAGMRCGGRNISSTDGRAGTRTAGDPGPGP